MILRKLAKYIGENVKKLIDRPDGEDYCFRVVKKRVYYMSKETEKMARIFKGDDLVAVGTCVGKFTHSKKFHITITALPLLEPLADYKIWLTAAGEQSFLYGNMVVKSMVERMTECTPRNVGVVIYGPTDKAIGFGMTARSTAETERATPMDVIAYRYADLGEYLRNEEAV